MVSGPAPPREIGRRIQDYGERLLRLTLDWCDELQAAIERGDLDEL
jgi:hypothetical protein